MNNDPVFTLQQRDYLIPVLGLCPLLAGVTNLQTGVVIGVTMLAVIVIVCLLHAVTRCFWPASIRLVVLLLISTCTVVLVHTLIQSWFYAVSQQLSLTIQLLAVNCVVLALADEACRQSNTLSYLFRTFLTGLIMMALLVMTGAIRGTAILTILQQPFGVFFILALVLAACHFIMARRSKSV